jgi:hypothetical protein
MVDAIRAGFRALGRNWGLALLLLVLNVLTAALLAGPMLNALEQALGSTDTWLGRFDDPWWSKALSAGAAAFGPDIFGIGGSPFENLELSLKGYYSSVLFVAARSTVSPAAVFLGIFYGVVQVFLTGGVVAVFRRGGAWTPRALLLGSGFYFGRLMRVTLLALALDCAIVGLDVSLAAWVDEQARNSVSVPGAIAWQMGRYALLFAGLLFVNLVSSYARIIVVVEERLSAVLAFLSSLSFCLGNLLHTAGHYLVMALMSIGLTAIWALAGRQWPATGDAILAVGLLLAEGLVLGRIALCLALMGGQVALYGRTASRLRGEEPQPRKEPMP